jgi:AraC-like DNA-binding protein
MMARTNEMGTAMEGLSTSIARLTRNSDNVETVLPGLTIYRRKIPGKPTSAMYPPSLCLVVQGAKRVLFGDQGLVYDAMNYLITGVNIPTVVQVVEADRKKPCLGLVLEIDRQEVSRLMIDSDLPTSLPKLSGRGMALGRVTVPLARAFQRLIDLLESPQDIPILAPMIKREILYRVLSSDQGVHLRQVALIGSQSNQVSRAVDWLKENFARPLRVEELAAQVNMSTSTLHHHFRALTAKSPLQYQKWLRLSEARRLMLIDNMDAATASFEVGYESPSQFSREYSRLFGNSPLKDITALRQAGVTITE